MCGIFGIYNHPQATKKTVLGLFSLQHRGQESVGITVANGQKMTTLKGMGLVLSTFQEENLIELEKINPPAAIGHVRYSTKGSSTLRNTQPVWAETLEGRFSLASNGDIINLTSCRKKLEKEKIKFQTSVDAEVMVKTIAYYLARDKKRDITLAISKMMTELKGSYSALMLTEKEMFVFRDPLGIRPLVMGKKDESLVFSSETCALDIIEAKYLREVKPGEIITLNKEGLKSVHYSKLKSSPVPTKISSALCVFELIYFSRPDSFLFGKSLHQIRQNMGARLAEEFPVKADLVIPLPDTGIPAAIGYAQASGIPYTEGIIKNRYIGRTFIEPTQEKREEKARLKYNPLRQIIKNKKLVVLEDSIVRGTTTKTIIKRLKEAGAKEIHMRISSPPYRFPCFYGIDTGVKEDLVASKKSVEAIRRFIGANSLGFLSLKGLFRAIGKQSNKFCTACFTGEYPIPIPKNIPSKSELEKLK